MEKRFKLKMDHSGQKYLFGQPSLNVIQRRWLEFICEYDFDINHIRGKENKVDGALSMRAHEMHDTTISMYKSYLSDKILEVCKLDQCNMDIKSNLQQGKLQ